MRRWRSQSRAGRMQARNQDFQTGVTLWDSEILNQTMFWSDLTQTVHDSDPVPPPGIRKQLH